MSMFRVTLMWNCGVPKPSLFPKPFLNRQSLSPIRRHLTQWPRSALSNPRSSPIIPPKSTIKPPLRTSSPFGIQSSQKRQYHADSTWLISPDNLVYSIIALNIGVYLAWGWAERNSPKALQFMVDNFTASYSDVKSFKMWRLVTVLFSHKDLEHLGFNMFTFYFLSSGVAKLMGPAPFLALYLGGGMLSVFGSLIFNHNFRNRDRSILGASGSIYSTMTFLACAVPKATFLILGIIPTPAWLAVGGIFAYDFYSDSKRPDSGTDHVAHMLGMLAGAAYFVFLV